MPTDEPDELGPASPEDEARIRALLSDARATEPMPVGVAARLDDVLVGLAAERGTVDPVPADNVIPIARTRRHRVVALLGAAAAVAVFGLAVGAVLDSDSGDDLSDAGGAADTAVDRGGDDAAEEAEANGPEAQETDTGDGDDPGRVADNLGDRAYAVRSRQLSGDLARIQALALPDPGAADYARALVHAPKDFACDLPPSGRGILVAVRYDGRPAYVRFLEPMGDSQVVEVLQCRTGDLVRSTTLPTSG